LAKGLRATLASHGLVENARRLGAALVAEDGIATAVSLIEAAYT